MIPLNKLAQQAAANYKDRFGQAPSWTVAAPGRVNIIGEHTDYNDGFVLPMAIERWTVLAAGPIPEPRVSIYSSAVKDTAFLRLDQTMVRGLPEWSNYIRGVIAGFQRSGISVRGFDAVMNSTVPLGSGLSSSAALEVAAATLLEASTGCRLDPIEKALLCQRAEHEFAGVPCGIMDQFTSALARSGQLLLLDCRSRAVQLVPMNDPSVAVLIVNTNVRHELASGEYGRRRAQCENAARVLQVPALRDASMSMLNEAQDRLDPVVFRRARHVLSEIKRTLTAAEAIAASDWAEVGKLMYESHSSLRDDYEVSCDELDAVVAIARQIGSKGGVIGCRMTGGGFGGCAVSLVYADRVDFIIQTIENQYRNQTQLEATTFVTRPAEGASIL